MHIEVLSLKYLARRSALGNLPLIHLTSALVSRECKGYRFHTCAIPGHTEAMALLELAW